MVRPELGPGDVERWDSIGHLAVVAAIEREFSIHFNEDEILEFATFQDILTAVERRVSPEPVSPLGSPEAEAGA
jgi:hypothetical protein